MSENDDPLFFLGKTVNCGKPGKKSMMSREEVEEIIVPVESTDDLAFYDVRKEPFHVYGLFFDEEEGVFRRMPKEAAERVSPGVLLRSTRSAGGRLRFFTDAERIAIKVKYAAYCRLNYFSEAGANGFDLYLDDGESGQSRFVKLFPFETDSKEGFTSEIKFNSRKPRFLTIHFPGYATVSELLVGLPKDALLKPGLSYKPELPIVYYGSSITQGACASRPGNAYENIVCRKTGIDYVNLGFSGQGKGEAEMAGYIASLDMSVFVMDYDHNAPNKDHLKQTHEPFFKIFREVHPETPCIFMSRPDFGPLTYEQMQGRKDKILETYRNARENGDRNVYFIDGESMFRGPYEDYCLVDNVHPNDLGFALMADAVIAMLERIRLHRGFD